MDNVSQAAPPFYPLTDSNHAALVVVTAIIFFIYAILGIVGKLIIRLNITSMKDFDIGLLVSALIYFIQTACVVSACSHGLGEHRDAISEDDFVRFSKVCKKLVGSSKNNPANALIVDVCVKNTGDTCSCHDENISQFTYSTNR
jgi:hypothetical protein